jgi:hypothetical protein
MARGDLPLRVVAMRRLGEPAWRAHGRLTPGAVKLLVEEGPDGMHPAPQVLRRSVAAAIRSGAQVAVHCVGAATLVSALDAFAAVPSRARGRRRHRLEHVAECPPPLVERIARLGLTVVTNPAFVYWRGDVYREETRGRATSWLYRARSLRARGVPLAGASDAPVVPPSPWIGMMAARCRKTATGAALGSAEALGATDALGLFTRGAAWALHADTLGRLSPGGPADLAIVDHDPLRVPPDELGATRTWLTMVDGRIVWHA